MIHITKQRSAVDEFLCKVGKGPLPEGHEWVAYDEFRLSNAPLVGRGDQVVWGDHTMCIDCYGKFATLNP